VSTVISLVKQEQAGHQYVCNALVLLQVAVVSIADE
jgi:hypothetical protein